MYATQSLVCTLNLETEYLNLYTRKYTKNNIRKKIVIGASQNQNDQFIVQHIQFVN